MKTLNSIIFAFAVALIISCNNLNIRDVNAPNIADLTSPEDFYSLIENGYNTWWNGAISASPSIAFCNANLFACGTPGWGSGPLWQIPRQPLFNGIAPNPVIIINFGAWYNFYSGIGTVMNMDKRLADPTYKIVLNGIDYTTRCKAHVAIIEALLYGNIALLYDKAYLFTNKDDALTFNYVANTKSYEDVMAYAIQRLDTAIALIKSDSVDGDYQEVMPGVTFDKQTLLQFANSMAARFLVENARCPADNALTDWAKVEAYAENGLQQNFSVSYEPGWQGIVIGTNAGSSYYWLFNADWCRGNQWLMHQMAPNDSAAVYPWPTGVDRLGEITNCPDARLNEYWTWIPNDCDSWFGWNRVSRPGYGYFIRCEYMYTRYFDVVNNGTGNVDHFLKAENDLYLAEAKIHLNESGAAALINNSRVGIGGLPPATDGDPDLMEKLFYERYVECDLVWPHLGYFDKRRLGQLLPGTAWEFPIPAPELISHGQTVYTFGGAPGTEM